MFDDILERKEVFSGDKNRNKKNIEKLRFFQRGLSMVSVKNWKFFHDFVFVKIRQNEKRKMCLTIF